MQVSDILRAVERSNLREDAHLEFEHPDGSGTTHITGMTLSMDLDSGDQKLVLR